MNLKRLFQILAFISMTGFTRTSAFYDNQQENSPESQGYFSGDIPDQTGLAGNFIPVTNPDDSYVYEFDNQNDEYLGGSLELQDESIDDYSSDFMTSKKRSGRTKSSKSKKCRVKRSGGGNSSTSSGANGIGRQVLNSLGSKWSLNLPISGKSKAGNMITLDPAGVRFFSLPEIFEPKANALVMTVNVDKVTKMGPGKSPNSRYYRTEFRQATPKYPGFSLADRKLRILEMEFSVDQLLNAPNGVVIAQIHGEGPLPNMELKVTPEGSIIPEDHKNSQKPMTTNNPKLVTNYSLGTKAKIKIVAGQGLIQFYYNGVLNSAVTIKGSYSGQYFKFGNYCQSTSPGAICTVSIYNVNFSEQ